MLFNWTNINLHFNWFSLVWHFIFDFFLFYFSCTFILSFSSEHEFPCDAFVQNQICIHYLNYLNPSFRHFISDVLYDFIGTVYNINWKLMEGSVEFFIEVKSMSVKFHLIPLIILTSWQNLKK